MLKTNEEKVLVISKIVKIKQDANCDYRKKDGRNRKNELNYTIIAFLKTQVALNN